MKVDVDYSYIDNEEFQKNYLVKDAPKAIDFYLENVKCIKCMNKIENATTQIEGIAQISLNLGSHIARISLTPGGRFADVASHLNKLGFPPHPISSRSELIEKKKNESKSMLNRLAVAGVLTGNIMLFTFSNYSGATEKWARIFDQLSAFFFLGVLLYCAIPFYKNTLSSLRSRSASIDLPIVLSILIGAGLSYFHLFRAQGDVYFDSLAMLVFLILTSRFILNSYQTSLLDPAYLKNFFRFSSAQKVDSLGNIVTLSPELIRPGDLLLINNQETIPVDGVIENEQAWLDNSVITGEFLPAQIKKNDICQAGAKSLGDNLKIRATSTMDSSQLGRLIFEVENQILKKTPLISLTDKLAQYFTLSVLLLGSVFFLSYMWIDMAEAVDRALALVILACPCALAFATPLSQSLSLAKLAKSGILVKKAEALENLSNIKSVIFDKTGTLSHGKLEFLGWSKDPTTELKSIIYALEKKSDHPVAKVLTSIVETAKAEELEIEDYKEVIGQGVFGHYQGHKYSIQTVQIPSHKEGPCVGIFKDGECLLTARFGDTIKLDSSKTIKEIRSLGAEIYIISGDNSLSVNHFAKQLNIKPENVFSQMSPQDKNKFIKNHPRSLMVGDGANDLLALASSSVSAVVQGGLEACLKLSDVYISEPGVSPVSQLIKTSRETMKVIRRNLVFSLVYNSLGATAALMGFINPLFAAILMPLSSSLVVLSTVYGTSELRNFSKTKKTSDQKQTPLSTREVQV